ncbi:hypothetical protein EG831_12355 [bacterium]|nr:hypothetical protein [bacterium]
MSDDPQAPENQRSGDDRRRSRLPRWRYLILGGRRRAVRRTTDTRRIFLLDRYSPKLFAAMMGIVVLSLTDAALTLYLVSHGASEINPVMNYFLQKGPVVFMVAKYVSTSVAVIIFVLLAHNVLPWPRRFAPQRLYTYALFAFGGVVAWEIFLICRLIARG